VSLAVIYSRLRAALAWWPETATPSAVSWLIGVQRRVVELAGRQLRSRREVIQILGGVDIVRRSRYRWP
jgi:hypothetical protein